MPVLKARIGGVWVPVGGAGAAPNQTMAYTQVTVGQTGIPISPSSDITGLSVTYTADPARRYRTTLYLTIYSSVANQVVTGYLKDAAGSSFGQGNLQLPLASNSSVLMVQRIETGLSGSVTRKASVGGTVAGSLSTTASAVFPVFILVEDIT